MFSRYKEKRTFKHVQGRFLKHSSKTTLVSFYFAKYTFTPRSQVADQVHQESIKQKIRSLQKCFVLYSLFTSAMSHEILESPVILSNQSCKCCFGIAEVKNRPVVFTSTFLGKNPLTRQTRRLYKLEWANQKHFKGTVSRYCACTKL